MAARAKKEKSKINLLPQEEFAASTFGRILAWLVSTFRVIVIATELIVVGAFLSRFWLDAKSTDLTDEIEKNQAIIATYADFEKDFRKAQKKINIFAEMTREEKTMVSTINSLTSTQPEEISLSSLSLSPQEATIKGVGITEQSILQFMVNLENSELFDKVVLTQVSTDLESSLITFTLKADLKGG